MGHIGLLANHEQNPNLIDLNGVVFNCVESNQAITSGVGFGFTVRFEIG